MAKKIRFPLAMADGVQVRTLDELKEHFDLEAVLEYYKSGKLLTWLQDRYLETEAEAIQALDEHSTDLPAELCKIFDVEYHGEPIDVDEIARRQERLKQLRTYTDEKDFIDHIDQVAFDQEELADLLDDGQKQIYLCGEHFVVPVSQRGVSYIGINRPNVKLTGRVPEDTDTEDLGLQFKDCHIENPLEKKVKTVSDFIDHIYKNLQIPAQAEININVQPQLKDDKSFEEGTPTHSIISGKKDELEYGIQEEIQYWGSLEDIDGLVLTVVDDKYQEILGRNGRTNKFQIALKFDPASAEGIVDSISLDCGKKGYRTIQVNLEHPVFLDGVRYDHIPVLSLPLFEKMDLHKYTKVKIHRVGDVIPSITVIKKGPGNKLEPPKKCPVCGDYLDVRNSKLYCQNPECKANIVGRFTNFMEGLGLDGYNDSFSEILVNNMDCKTLADIIELTVDDFKNAGVKGELAKKFPDALKQALNEKYDYEILACMGLPGIGPARAKLILQEETFAEMAGDKDRINLWPVNKYFAGDFTMSIYLRSDNIRRDFHVISKYVKHNCKGMKDRIRVGHTGGELSDEVKELCKQNNFEIVDGKNFDILIAKDLTSTSGKMELAKKKQLPIYLEEIFLDDYAIPEPDDEEEDEDEDYTPPKKKNLINKIFKK